MRSILSLGLTAIAASTSAVSAETTIAVLEFGPGGSVHRTISATTESSATSVSSFWNVLHRTSKRGASRHAGMPVVPDMFNPPDAGIVVSLHGDSLKSMPTAASLGAGEVEDHVVGHIHVPGQTGSEIVKRASSKDVELIAKDDVGRRLQSAAETAARGAMEGFEVLSLAVDNYDDAASADEHLGRMLKTLEKTAAESGKTVVVHLVMDSAHRRLEEQEGDGENGNNNNAYAYNYRSMYEIQTFNLYLWTSVGLLVVLFMVIGAFIDMPLMPDTLLYGEAKMAD